MRKDDVDVLGMSLTFNSASRGASQEKKKDRLLGHSSSVTFPYCRRELSTTASVPICL